MVQRLVPVVQLAPDLDLAPLLRAYRLLSLSFQ